MSINRKFIINGLRALSNKWRPKYEVKKAARVRRGVYLCAGYKRAPHEVRAKEIEVDHIDPVIDPDKGFTDWNDYIARLFVEEDKLQVLCKECHKKKTNDEAKKRRNV